MSIFNISNPITITCHNRIAPYLASEVASLGYDITQKFATGVMLEGTLKDCIKLNLNLRCASQVLFLISHFEAINAGDIYDNVFDIAWEDILPEDAYISITSNVKNDTINNNMFANLRVKDAIVDRLREIRGTRPNTGSELDGAVIHLHWKDDEAMIYIDTSGKSLGRHGYRKIPGRAPMLEALASATILASKWDQQTPFINPMCGSGTLAIEAALIAKNARPGLFRNNYSFMHLMDYEESYYLKELRQLKAQINNTNLPTIVASDYSDFAVENTQKNAFAAGVEDMITYQVCDFVKTEVPYGQNGVVFLNPEYGERLGENTELEATYKRIGDFLKQSCKGYTGYIFTGNIELGKRIGLKPTRRIEFYNSKIDCRLYEYDLYDGSKNKAE
jgi:putative N6-adenine-specific DNA methylase